MSVFLLVFAFDLPCRLSVVVQPSTEMGDEPNATTETLTQQLQTGKTLTSEITLNDPIWQN